MVGHRPPGRANTKAKLDLTIFPVVGKTWTRTGGRGLGGHGMRGHGMRIRNSGPTGAQMRRTSKYFSLSYT